MSSDEWGGLAGDGVLAFGALLVLVVAELGARERLRRQKWFGIRLKATLRSDKAWRAAHLRAAPWLRWTAIVDLLLAAMDLAGRLTWDDWRPSGFLPLAFVVLVVGVLVGAVVGVRAAKRA